MKRTLLPFFLTLAAVPSFAQSTFQSFTPRYEADGTTYVNAEVVRVNAGGTMTLRSESGDLELTADSHAVPGLAGLRSAEKVLIAFDTVTDDDGRTRRVVTFARQASPTSGEPGPSFAMASATATGSTVRIVSTDRTNRTLTVTDTSGTPMVLPVSIRTARSLGSLNPGDVVGLTFTNGGVVTAVNNTVGSGLSGLRPGDNLVGGSTSRAGANAAGTGVPGRGTFNPMGAGNGLPFVGGVAVPTGVGPTSPYASTVPSIPSPTPLFNAVLPPAIAKAPLSDEDVGEMREHGERDLGAAAVVLAAHANDIDAHWFRFVNGCLGGITPESTPGRQWFLLLDGRVRTPTDDGCRASYTSLTGMANGWEQQLNITLDAARRADVLPGRVRETLDRHRIDR